MDSSHLPQELALTLNQYSANHKTIKIQCLLTNKNFHEIAEIYEHRPDYKVVKNESIKFGTFTCTLFSVQSNKTDEELGQFQSLQISDELYILSGSKAEFFDKIVLQILQRLYPIVLSAFIHSNEIYEILAHFETIMDIELKKKDAVRKQIFGFSPKTKLDWDVCKEGRIYPTFHETFEESKHSDLWIDSIKVFSGEHVKEPNIQFSISRKGLVSLDKGVFDSIFSNVLHPIIKRSKQRREQFEHRSRSEQPDKKPKPLIVKFGKDVFKKMETREEFSRILEKYTHCNYSIMYSKNPHVYLSILDRNDNSSFAIRTFGENSLLLIPQIKTSSLSLMRFSEFLVSSFHEGVIENFKQEEKEPLINK